MQDQPLNREEMRQVIEGKGAARRVPIAVQMWVNPTLFGDQQDAYAKVLNDYPCDIVLLPIQIPDAFQAP